MNIVFWCDEYPPVESGGIGYAVKIVAESLAKKGHNIFIISVIKYGQNLPSFTIINKVTIYRLTHFKQVFFLNYFPVFLRGKIEAMLKLVGIMNICAKKSLFKAERFVDDLIKKAKIDLIEIPDFLLHSKYFKKNIQFYRFPITTIIRVHGCNSFLSYFNKGEIPKKIKQIDINNFSRADFVCAVSLFSANFVTNNLGIIKSKISVIYNPIENSFLSENLKRKESSSNIVFIGKVIESKGAFKLIDAFNDVAYRYPELTLTFLGSGEIKYAKTKVRSEIKHRVLFSGYVSRNSIIDIIDNSMFCIIPSYFENFSMCAIEVMARRKALIYTIRSSGPELITDGENGLLVDPDDKNQIIDAMEKIIIDSSFRTRLENAGYQKVINTYSEEIISSQLEELYRNCIILKKNDKYF